MPYADPVHQQRPYQSGSETSRDAAIKASAFSGQQSRTYAAWIESRGADGGTDKEAHRALGIERSSLCARRRDLVKAGKVRETESRREGCAVFVWVG